MARDEKKFKYPRVSFKVHSLEEHSAQSTLEYALIFPLLFVMILGIFELALMWHSYNSLQFAAQDVASNIVLGDSLGCVSPEEMTSIVKKKTAFLQEKSLSFSYNDLDGVTTIQSNELYRGKPFVAAKIDCSFSQHNLPKVQMQSVHKLHFFSASLPNFKTAERIILIPDNVVFTSTKFYILNEI